MRQYKRDAKAFLDGEASDDEGGSDAGDKPIG